VNRRFALCAALLSAAPNAVLPQQPGVVAMADTVFARWNSTHTPGCAVGVARDGKTLLARGYGMADLETGTPITAETIFESGSVAKQFTATAIVLLAMDGKLDLADPVRKYLPEFPQYDRPITIRHLLTHTSGLRDWSNLVAAAGWPRGTRASTQADLLDILYRQKTLNYPVGDYYSYTNSGFAVLMSLVERVSGKPFQEFTQERIFGPLGMTHTRWRDDFTRLVPGRAQAYGLARGGEWRLDMPFENVVGPGGLLTTVGDWLIWNDALTRNTLRPGHADSLTRRMKLTSGREIQYALGLIVSTYRGVAEIGHSGSTGGYSTYLTRFPDRGNLSIAILCNSSAGAATAYAHQLADRLITDFPRPAPVDTTRVDATEFAKYAGFYRNDRTHAAFEVSAVPGPLLRAMPGGWYRQANDQRLRFEMGANGKPVSVSLTQGDGDTVRYPYVTDKAWQPTAQELKAFEGSYRSDEVGATYQVRVAGDTLTYSMRPGVTVALRPTFTDAFARGGNAVWFTRDRGGRVTAMHFGEGRMWDLTLTRLP
jgi:CubicO group peptidase (beta-lactamase class C family)